MAAGAVLRHNRSLRGSSTTPVAPGDFCVAVAINRCSLCQWPPLGLAQSSSELANMEMPDISDLLSTSNSAQRATLTGHEIFPVVDTALSASRQNLDARALSFLSFATTNPLCA